MADLDLLPTPDLLALLLDHNAQAVAAVGRAMSEIAAAIEAIVPRIRDGGRLHYAGAGTSGRLALLDAAECPPTFGVSPDLVQAHLAGGPDAFVRPLEDAEDDREAGARAIASASVGPGDVVAGVAASGSTPFVLGALAEARLRGGLTIGIACAPASPLAALADLSILLDVGPEALRGSTRLKAGTAQKITLNMISTGVMIRLGYVYGDLMVGVRLTNAKLRARAAGILATLSGLDPGAAGALLARCDQDVRVALLCARLDLAPDAARVRLVAAGGDVRRALGER